MSKEPKPVMTVNWRKATPVIVGVVVGTILLFSIYFFFIKPSQEPVLMFIPPETQNWTIGKIHPPNCSDANFTGIYLNMTGIADWTNERRAGFTHGWIMAWRPEPLNQSDPLLTITINCDNRTYEKEYWDASDFDGTTDCVEENICFIKYEGVD